MTAIPFRREIAEAIARLFSDAPHTGWDVHDRSGLAEQELRSKLHERYTWGEIDVAIAELLKQRHIARGSFPATEERNGEIVKCSVPAYFHERSLWAYLEPATPPEPTAAHSSEKQPLPPWRAEGLTIEERLQKLVEARPEAVGLSSRKLGKAIGRSHTAVRETEWYKERQGARELAKRHLKAISVGEYFDQYGN